MLPHAKILICAMWNVPVNISCRLMCDIWEQNRKTCIILNGSSIISLHFCLFPSVFNTFHSSNHSQNIEENYIKEVTNDGFLVVWLSEASIAFSRTQNSNFILGFWVIITLKKTGSSPPDILNCSQLLWGDKDFIASSQLEGWMDQSCPCFMQVTTAGMRSCIWILAVSRRPCFTAVLPSIWFLGSFYLLF